jgi:hypothetical protein
LACAVGKGKVAVARVVGLMILLSIYFYFFVYRAIGYNGFVLGEGGDFHH